MKIKHTLYLAALFPTSLIFNSCKKSYPESCNKTVHTALSYVSGGDSISMNSIKDLQVHFNAYNGCGQFSHFEETSNGNTKTIRVFAKYVGCFCTQAIKPVTEDYYYTVPSTGTYTFKFIQPDNSQLVNTVTVF